MGEKIINQYSDGEGNETPRPERAQASERVSPVIGSSSSTSRFTKKILACPCCKSDRIAVIKPFFDMMELKAYKFYRIKCMDCFIMTGEHKRLKDAIKVWNNRA